MALNFFFFHFSYKAEEPWQTLPELPERAIRIEGASAHL
jgi:hypothetical protein